MTKMSWDPLRFAVTGEGGRIGAERKKTKPEMRRMKPIGGGKTAPSEYKS